MSDFFGLCYSRNVDFLKVVFVLFSFDVLNWIEIRQDFNCVIVEELVRGSELSCDGFYDFLSDVAPEESC